MRMTPSFDPSLKTSDTIAAQLVNVGGAIVLFNKSQYGLIVDFGNGRVAGLPAWYVRTYRFPTTVVDSCTWTRIYTLNQAGTPISLVMGELYDSNEVVPQSDGPIPWLSNVGNSVSTVGGSATSVQNDNQPLTPSNVFVESTPTGAGSSTVSIATDGTVTIKGDVANVLTTLLQLIPSAASGASSVKLADASRTTEVLGKMLVDGNTESVGSLIADSTLTVTGTSSFTGQSTFNATGISIVSSNDTQVNGSLKTNTIRDNVNGNAAIDLSAGTGEVKVPKALTTNGGGAVSLLGNGSGSIHIGQTAAGDTLDTTAAATFLKHGTTVQVQVPSGTNIGHWDSSGYHLDTGSIAFQAGSISRDSSNHATSISGVVITHGMGATPQGVLICTDIAQAGSATIGAGSLGATTFTATCGAGSGFWWRAWTR